MTEFEIKERDGTLIYKTEAESFKDAVEKAVKETGIQCVVIAGGVSANSELRKRLSAKINQGWKVSIPKFSYCTDNAAMIAMAGKFLFESGVRADQSVSAQARLAW
mgnify:CR=1 FL=1